MVKPTLKSFRNFKALFLIALLGVLYTSSNFHIEWLWFSQFSFQNILLVKWKWQICSIFFSTIIVISNIIWQNKWFEVDKKDNNKIDAGSILTGFKYGISLFITHSILLITYLFIALLSFISFNDPLSTHLWYESINTQVNLVYFCIFILLPTIAVLVSNINFYRFLQYLSSLMIVYISTNSWTFWALAFNLPLANYKEDIFGTDISFSLGQFQALYLANILLISLSLITLSSSLSYFLLRNNRFTEWKLNRLTLNQRKLIKIPLVLTTVFLTIHIWISKYQFLWKTNELISGPGWLDHNINIPLRNISFFSLLIFTLSLIIQSGIYKNKLRYITIILSIIPFLIELTISPFIDWIFVKPRQLSLESKYISKNIQATRRAFKLDSIINKSIYPKEKLTNKDITNGEKTINNISLWDTQPLLDTNRQLQQLRLYYTFSNVAVDRYQLIGNQNKLQQVMISARELDQRSIPDKSRTWINKHFVFTHGYGFTVSPVNAKSLDGLPHYFIRDLGSISKIEGLKSLNINRDDIANTFPIGKPAIYYGAIKSQYVIAPSKINELDYPEGGKNIFTNYEGSGGIPLRTLLQRISASIYLNEPRLITTSSLTDKSRLLIRRDVKNRVKKLVPFLEILGDPYLISVNIKNERDYDSKQKQYWIVEGFTSSHTYPYSSSTNSKINTRYIRNSVKAVVDAYNGKIKLYIIEPEDPIIKGWKNTFPGLFDEIEDMPDSITKHIKVPMELFKIQASKLLRYHVTDTKTFYSGDDIWQVPKEIYGKEEVPVKPYNIIGQLNTGENPEFLLLQPFSPIGRPNLSAWLAARNDGSNYGKLLLLRFPSETSIFGPEQIQALINQDPDISKQFSLWDRAGSEVIQGNLMVLPIGDALLYVEPVYLKASNGGLPTLTRVVVSDGQRIEMGVDLKGAIQKLKSRN